MTTALDIAALCAAIDAGDDGVLPILADALEEAQDARAAGLRLVGDRRPSLSFGGRVGAITEGAAWNKAPRGARAGGSEVTEGLYRRIRGQQAHEYEHVKSIKGDLSRLHFATRSAAFLALAQALTE